LFSAPSISKFTSDTRSICIVKVSLIKLEQIWPIKIHFIFMLLRPFGHWFWPFGPRKMSNQMSSKTGKIRASILTYSTNFNFSNFDSLSQQQLQEVWNIWRFSCWNAGHVHTFGHDMEGEHHSSYFGEWLKFWSTWLLKIAILVERLLLCLDVFESFLFWVGRSKLPILNISVDWIVNFSISMDVLEFHNLETPPSELQSLLFDVIYEFCMPKNVHLIS